MKVLFAAVIAALVLLCFQAVPGAAAVDPAGAVHAVSMDQGDAPIVVAEAVTEHAPVVMDAAPVEVNVATSTTATETDSIVDAGQKLIDAYKTGGWLALLAALVTLLTALLRKPWMGGLLERIPKRARILVPLLLGCIAALLTAAAGGISWGEAAVLAFLIGPSAVTLHQGIARSLFGIDSPATKAAKSTAAGYFK